MAKYEVWKITTLKESVEVEAPSREAALDEVVEYSNDIEFEFMDAEHDYEIYEVKESN